MRRFDLPGNWYNKAIKGRSSWPLSAKGISSAVSVQNTSYREIHQFKAANYEKLCTNAASCLSLPHEEKSKGAFCSQPHWPPPHGRCPDGFVQLLVCQTTGRSEEHTSELPSLLRISYAVLCLKKKTESNNRRER